jgi:hypothetical protein
LTAKFILSPPHLGCGMNAPALTRAHTIKKKKKKSIELSSYGFHFVISATTVTREARR